MKKIIYLLMGLLILSPTIVLAEENKQPLEKEPVFLEKCVDGDTANFKDKEGKIYKTRFLAIDTPETVHPTKGKQPYGKEASEYVCTTLTNAEVIELEYDPNSDKEDKYGRRLSWIFVDGILLQETIVSKGLAQVAYLYGDYKYTDILKETETEAKNQKIGIWSESKPKEEKEVKAKVTKKNKNFLDNLLGKVFDYVDNLLEKIASWIEDMI